MQHVFHLLSFAFSILPYCFHFVMQSRDFIAALKNPKYKTSLPTCKIETGLCQLFSQICRDAVTKYIKNVTNLGETLFELLLLALGLKAEHLLEIGCPKEYILLCQYYPPYPQPDLTLGATGHSDPSFLTIFLQDQLICYLTK